MTPGHVLLSRRFADAGFSAGGRYDPCGVGLVYGAINEDGNFDPDSKSGNYRCYECVDGEWKYFGYGPECYGDVKSVDHMVTDPLPVQDELATAPPKCRDAMSWADPINENSSFEGFSEPQSAVSFAALSTGFPSSVTGVAQDEEGNLGFDTSAERKWRKGLKNMALETRHASNMAHPYVAARMREWASRSNAALNRIGTMYGWKAQGLRPLYPERNRATIRGLYLRALQLLWCSLYMRALSESFYKNEAAALGPVEVFHYVPPKPAVAGFSAGHPYT